MAASNPGPLVPSVVHTRPSWVPHPDTLKYGHRRVLSLDGGGIRGIILGVVLEYLEDTILEVLNEQHPQENIQRKDIYLADYFDVVSGTSTGGLLALYIASRGHTHDSLGNKGWLGLKGEDRAKREQGPFRKGSATAALQLYRANATTIFENKVPSLVRKIPLFGAFVEKVNEAVVSSKYAWEGIERVLQSTFGDGKRNTKLTLKDLATSVVIPSFNAREISPFTFFWNSYENCRRAGFTFVGSNPHDRYSSDELHTFSADFALWQVARATSAAPTFFPAAKVTRLKDSPLPWNEYNVQAPEEPMELIDGGVCANDPAFQAVLLQGKMYGTSKKTADPDAQLKWLLPTDFAILSIGTGTIKSAAPQGRGAQLFLVADLVGKVLMASASDLVHSYFKAMMDNLPPGQKDKPEEERLPCPYLRIQKTDTSTDNEVEQAKLANDVLRREPTDWEKKLYKNVLVNLDDVREDNMDMLEHVGEFLGRHITGQVPGRPKNTLKAYVKEYVLGKK